MVPPERWVRFPAAWLSPRRLTEPPRTCGVGGTNPSARLRRAPPLAGEALRGMPPKGFLCGGRAYLSPSAAADGLPPSAERGKGWRQCRHKLLFRARWARPKGFPIALWKPSAPTYKQYQNQSSAGRGGSVSRRAHNPAYRECTHLSGGITYAKAHPSNASRSSGGSAREGLLSEKPPPSHTPHVSYSQLLFGRGGLGERRFS